MPSRYIITLSENFYYIIGNLIYYIIGKFLLHYRDVLHYRSICIILSGCVTLSGVITLYVVTAVHRALGGGGVPTGAFPGPYFGYIFGTNQLFTQIFIKFLENLSF